MLIDQDVRLPENHGVLLLPQEETATPPPILMFRPAIVGDRDLLFEVQIRTGIAREIELDLLAQGDFPRQEETMMVDIDLHLEEESVVHLLEGKESLQGTCLVITTC